MSKKFAVIGHPIGHTMSPFIHDRLFKLSGIDARYSVIDISPENLERDYNETLKNLDGYNITIPHKQNIIPLLDEIDEKAEMYGSVNTVSNVNGKARGYTTDPDGFLEALKYASIDLNGRVVILGCGGVARTMAYEALLKNAKLEFAVREKSIPKVKELIKEIKSKLNNPDVSFCDINELSGGIDLLVNATPVGMSPNTDNMPVPESVLKNCANVYDAIYNPLKTKLIKTALKNGAKAEGGMSMLVWQAVVSHRHWNNSVYDVKDIEKLCEDAAKELMSR
jgi:shikimate dehydrogenase